MFPYICVWSVKVWFVIFSISFRAIFELGIFFLARIRCIFKRTKMRWYVTNCSLRFARVLMALVCRNRNTFVKQKSTWALHVYAANVCRLFQTQHRFYVWLFFLLLLLLRPYSICCIYAKVFLHRALRFYVRFFGYCYCYFSLTWCNYYRRNRRFHVSWVVLYCRSLV